jgi:FkbM family methyltransferase
MMANEFKRKGGKVIAIEAHPENYSALCRNIKINNFENIIKPINIVA